LLARFSAMCLWRNLLATPSRKPSTRKAQLGAFVLNERAA
jgi:hypothetical protein